MAGVEAYRMRPRAAFHFGERGVGIEETSDAFRSDALFSALCCVVQEAWGTSELEHLLDRFLDGDPPFLLSSCFPFAGSTLFFPRPMLPSRIDGEVAEEVGKRLKRTRFVSRALFGAWLAGEDLSREAAANCFVSGSNAWLARAELAQVAPLVGAGSEGAARALWWRDAADRVTVDRETSASAVYRCGRLLFREGCGLYFLIRWRDESFRGRIDEALALLADAGIGGRRSAGYGQFTLEAAEPLEVEEPDGAHAALTLSLYWPTTDELARGVLGGGARYELVARHGWMSSPWGRAVRRRQVRMLTEGSVLAGAAQGALAEVTPAGFDAHAVYRYGLAFTVPVAAAAVGHESVT